MKTVMAVMLLAFLLAVPFSEAAGCIYITQQDLDRGPYLITASGQYCLAEDLHVDYDWGSQHGFKVLDVQTRAVHLNLMGRAIINDDGSNFLEGNFSSYLEAIAVRGPPLTGTELSINNGKIIGFDFAIKDVALKITQKLVVNKVYFLNNYNALWARPERALVAGNQFINTLPFRSSVQGISLQETTQALIKNNYFFNHHTTIELFNVTLAEVRSNYLKSSEVQFPVLPRGIVLYNSKEATVANNYLGSFYLGVQVLGDSSASIIRNRGCQLATPVQVIPPARVGEAGNAWNSC